MKQVQEFAVEPTTGDLPSTFTFPARARSRRMKDMPTGIQPRELIDLQGVEHVQDDVLLAVILRTGTKGRNVQELAKVLIERYGSLTGIARASVKELASTSGIGKVKAQCLKSALEMGRRLNREAHADGFLLKTPRDVAAFMAGEVRSLDCERVWVLVLDAKSKVQGGPRVITEGILDSSLVHPREIFKEAVRASAAAVLVVHNHPSGDPTPSAEDLRVTRQLVEAGKVVGIKVVDHVVLGGARPDGSLGYVSIKEQGLVDF